MKIFLALLIALGLSFPAVCFAKNPVVLCVYQNQSSWYVMVKTIDSNGVYSRADLKYSPKKWDVRLHGHPQGEKAPSNGQIKQVCNAYFPITDAEIGITINVVEE